MIKAVIFDRHGVFDKVTRQSMREKIASYTEHKDADDVKDLLKKPRLQYDAGILKSSDFWGIVQEILKISPEQTKSCKDYLLTIQPIQELRDIIPILAKSYTLGILSDCPPDKKEIICKQYQDIKLFPYIFRSCDYSKTKSQWAEFFEIMYMYLHENDIIQKPEQILFVDDTLSNVKQAQELWIMACHFQNINDLKKFIHR